MELNPVLVALVTLGALSATWGTYVFATRQLTWFGRSLTKIAIGAAPIMWLVAALFWTLSHLPYMPGALLSGFAIVLLLREVIQRWMTMMIYRLTTPQPLILKDKSVMTLRHQWRTMGIDRWFFEGSASLERCTWWELDALEEIACHMCLRNSLWPRWHIPSARASYFCNEVEVKAQPSVTLQMFRWLKERFGKTSTRRQS